MILEAQNLTLSYGASPVLSGLQLALYPGELLGIIGANGTGKTTLLKALCGLHAPDAGDVVLDGHSVYRMGGNARARVMAYMAQSSQCHHPLSVLHLVALGRMPHMPPLRPISAADMQVVEAAMRDADVLHLKDRIATTLSGGEYVRVMLARALATQPRVLLVDEPVAGPDPAHQLTIMEMLRAKAASGMVVGVVLHDLTLASRFCDRLIMLHEGGVAAQGSPAQVLQEDNVNKSLNISILSEKHNGESYVVPWRTLRP